MERSIYRLSSLYDGTKWSMLGWEDQNAHHTVKHPSAPEEVEEARLLPITAPQVPSRVQSTSKIRWCRSCIGWVAWIGSVILVGTALPMMGIDPPRMRYELGEMFSKWWFEDSVHPVSSSGWGGGGRLSPDDVLSVVKHNYPNVDIFATDQFYLAPNVHDIQAFLAQSITKDYVYVAERHDCDDFAQIMQGELRQYEYALGNNHSWAFGQAFGPQKDDATKLHAFNMFIDRSRRLWLVDPQNNEVSSVGEFAWRVTSIFM